VKLWVIKNNECINTFADQHEGKIWSMALTPDEKRLVTGGSDGLLHIWQDVTQAEIDQTALEKSQRVAKEQTLVNALRKKNYKKAITLALELEQPRRLLNIFSDLLRPHSVASKPSKSSKKSKNEVLEVNSDDEDEEVVKGEEIIIEVVKAMDKEKLAACLRYIRDWNTNAKHSLLAQQVLGCIVRVYPPATLKQLPGIKELLESLVSYTQRHVSRLDKLIQKSFLLDYTLWHLHSGVSELLEES